MPDTTGQPLPMPDFDAETILADAVRDDGLDNEPKLDAA
jgi:hypothetical protein